MIKSVLASDCYFEFCFNSGGGTSCNKCKIYNAKGKADCLSRYYKIKLEALQAEMFKDFKEIVIEREIEINNIARKNEDEKE